MKFLVPVGGDVEECFGVLTSPAHFGIPKGVRDGRSWAADNGAFTKAFSPQKFVKWLEIMQPYRSTCLFVAVPDVLADSKATLEKWHEWYDVLSDWPTAFVCQDGQTPETIPLNCSAVFIGGTTDWKLGDGARRCIEWGVKHGKHVHIGRVNWLKRYMHFRSMPGSDNFTCDGTRVRFDGKERTLKAWKEYMSIQI